jgi:hypothetical protein
MYSDDNGPQKDLLALNRSMGNNQTNVDNAVAEVSGRLLAVEIILCEYLIAELTANNIQPLVVHKILSTSSVRIERVCDDLESRSVLESATIQTIRQRAQHSLKLMRRNLDNIRPKPSRRIW